MGGYRTVGAGPGGFRVLRRRISYPKMNEKKKVDYDYLEGGVNGPWWEQSKGASPHSGGQVLTRGL